FSQTRQPPFGRAVFEICGILACARSCCLLSAGFVLFLSTGCQRGEAPSRTPSAPRDGNILLITLDTTRADHLSCYSRLNPAGTYAKTPNLDALANRGVMFAQATVQAPVTLPSHASILTGTYPPMHGLRDMEGFALDKSRPTLASIAQSG